MLDKRRKRCLPFVALLLWAACGDDAVQPPPGPTPGFLEPDFSLVDVNANSATGAQVCSPRQQLGKVSAWYFGHAT